MKKEKGLKKGNNSDKNKCPLKKPYIVSLATIRGEQQEAQVA